MATREILLARKRLNDMAKIAADMERQLMAIQGELEAFADIMPDHAEQAAESLGAALESIGRFARAVAL